MLAQGHFEGDMDGIEINYRLRRLGMTQAGIANELGISSSVVSNTIHSRVTCHRAAARIAELLGEPIQALWPDRYVFKARNPKSPARERSS